MASYKKNFNNAKKAAKKVKKHSTRLLVCLVILAILVGAFYLSLRFERKIDDALGFRRIEVFNKGDMVFIGGMTIHFIDVGQGDATLIELPDGKTMLIDAGENNPEVEQKLDEYMDYVDDQRSALGLDPILFFDYVVATHSHEDHIGSMDYILNRIPAATFYRPNMKATYNNYTDPASLKSGRHGFRPEGFGEHSTAAYRYAIEAGYRAHPDFVQAIVTNPHDSTQNKIKPNLPATDDNYYEINFYGPVDATYTSTSSSGKSTEDYNDYSAILVAEYKGRRVALSGDAEETGEKQVAEMAATAEAGSHYDALNQDGYRADVLKVGHHGSNTSTTKEYLDVFASEDMEQAYAVISVGANTYGHPTDKVLSQLDKYGFEEENILRTDLLGDIVIQFGFYEGHEAAFVDYGALIDISYPVSIGGLTVSYRIAGIAALVVIGIILLIIGLTGKKPTGKSNNSNKTNKPKSAQSPRK